MCECRKNVSSLDKHALFTCADWEIEESYGKGEDLKSFILPSLSCPLIPLTLSSRHKSSQNTHTHTQHQQWFSSFFWTSPIGRLIRNHFILLFDLSASCVPDWAMHFSRGKYWLIVVGPHPPPHSSEHNAMHRRYSINIRKINQLNSK